MDEKERALYDDVVHRLRMRGWDRVNAEAEASDVIERRRATLRQIADSGNSINAHLAAQALETEHGNG